MNRATITGRTAKSAASVIADKLAATARQQRDALSKLLHEQAARAIERLQAHEVTTPDEAPELAALHEAGVEVVRERVGPELPIDSRGVDLATTIAFVRDGCRRREWTFPHEGRRYRALLLEPGRRVLVTTKKSDLPLTAGVTLELKES